MAVRKLHPAHLRGISPKGTRAPRKIELQDALAIQAEFENASAEMSHVHELAIEILAVTIGRKLGREVSPVEAKTAFHVTHWMAEFSPGWQEVALPIDWLPVLSIVQELHRDVMRLLREHGPAWARAAFLRTDAASARQKLMMEGFWAHDPDFAARMLARLQPALALQFRVTVVVTARHPPVATAADESNSDTPADFDGAIIPRFRAAA
jgi:hypothetical protein